MNREWRPRKPFALTVELIHISLKKPFSWAMTIGRQSVSAIIPNFIIRISGPSPLLLGVDRLGIRLESQTRQRPSQRRRCTCQPTALIIFRPGNTDAHLWSWVSLVASPTKQHPCPVLPSPSLPQEAKQFTPLIPLFKASACFRMRQCRAIATQYPISTASTARILRKPCFHCLNSVWYVAIISNIQTGKNHQSLPSVD